MNRHVLSRAFRLAGWEGGKRGAAQRGIRAASVQAWRTHVEGSRGESTESEEPRTSPEGTIDSG